MLMIAHVGSKHMLLKEVAPPEVWATIPPRYSQAKTGGAQQPPQGLVIAAVESEVPAPPFEASFEAVDLHKAEASVAVSPVELSCMSGPTPNNGDIRDIFDSTDEESNNEMEQPTPSHRPIENLESPLLLSTFPEDGD